MKINVCAGLRSAKLIFSTHTDGQTLPINRRQKAYNNGTLIIEQLQRVEDAGTYTCMAQNKQKQAARRNVEILVLSKHASEQYIDGLHLFFSIQWHVFNYFQYRPK